MTVVYRGTKLDFLILSIIEEAECRIFAYVKTQAVEHGALDARAHPRRPHQLCSVTCGVRRQAYLGL